MTAPAVDQIVTQATGLEAPTPAVTPAPDTSAQGASTMRERAVALALKVAPDAPAADQSDAPQSESTATPPAEGTVESTATSEAAAPEGEPVAAPDQAALEQGTELGTGDALFRIRDPQTGKFVEPPPVTVELAIRDKDTGEVKVYQKSVAELARMARDGVAGQRVLGELQAVKQDAQQMQELVESFRELMREVFTNEDAYLDRREQFLQDNSPEQRLARLQAQIEQDRAAELAAREQQVFQQEVQTFHQTRIAPVVDDAVKVLGQEAVLGKITMLTADLVGPDGRIARQHWPEYEARITGPFHQWVKEAAKKVAPVTPKPAAPSAEQVAQHKAVQAAGEVLKPVGSVGSSAPAPLPPPRDFAEAKNRLIHRTTHG